MVSEVDKNQMEIAMLEKLKSLTDEQLQQYRDDQLKLPDEETLYEMAVQLRDNLPTFAEKYPNLDTYSLHSRFLGSYYEKRGLEGREAELYDLNYSKNKHLDAFETRIAGRVPLTLEERQKLQDWLKPASWTDSDAKERIILILNKDSSTQAATSAPETAIPATPLHSYETVARSYRIIKGELPLDFPNDQAAFQAVVTSWENYWRAKNIDPTYALRIAEAHHRQTAYGSDDLMPTTATDIQNFYNQVESKLKIYQPSKRLRDALSEVDGRFDRQITGNDFLDYITEAIQKASSDTELKAKLDKVKTLISEDLLISKEFAPEWLQMSFNRLYEFFYPQDSKPTTA